mmetsp:Transcript_10926/g.16378  ORF Transcript_10926/g.16378 Transcript_10926/m.16378 type:complete len:313 (-) Transcript_10926:234-1172(-)|eukprot:CAMPEP_0196818568 /NCGR_PEP_ID=MMETSP1362-20130617/66270_1 /TAXON_ID=163516 /ORGANISM="Leptocylindrus danicus, Strain CCMP1856" /LENGTH=312 /DNA_ID=CAMNT_0042196719 /DNA_START=66 /DNA_END=1004 /DNA_ORIENTATION=+
MTIIYDSKNHFKVIFSITGTVWPSVLPLCLINVAITLAVYLLRDYDVVDLTFADDGHKILATMVAFLVVSRVSAAYNRFWEARTLLSKALQQCRQLSIHASAFSREDKNEKADKWRMMISKRTIKLLKKTMSVLEDPEKTVELLHNTRRQDEDSLKDDPMELVAYVHAAITLQKKYLSEPLIIHKELKLHQYASEFTNYYHELAKFSATPYPFPTAQMTRIFLFVWMFSLPFALVHVSEEPYSIVLIIFFITYGFFGLEFVSIELDDPFGDDPNDLEMDALSKVIIKGIQDDLERSSIQTGGMTQDSYDVIS